MMSKSLETVNNQRTSRLLNCSITLNIKYVDWINSILWGSVHCQCKVPVLTAFRKWLSFFCSGHHPCGLVFWLASLDVLEVLHNRTTKLSNHLVCIYMLPKNRSFARHKALKEPLKLKQQLTYYYNTLIYFINLFMKQ